MKKKKILIILIAIVLVGLIVAGAVSFAGGGRSYSYKVKKLNEVFPENAGTKYHKFVSDNSLFVAKSGLIELYFDKETYAIAVKDTSADVLWSSVPVSEGWQEQAAVLSAKLSDSNGNIYYLNSQDNSVAFKSASFEPHENGISVTYRMALTEEKASYAVSQLDSETPAAEITVDYTLTDGSLYASILNSDIYSPKGIKVESVTLLDFLSCTKKTTAEDFIFVPDGCGALIMTGIADKTDEQSETDYSFGIYNKELNASGAHSAIVPAFGMKQGDAAFLAIIESGDTVALINASRGETKKLSGRVGAAFDVEPKIYSESLNSRESIKVYERERTNENISVCYRFLSGKNATYTGFSTACREQLIRNGVLSNDTVEQSEYYPFFITLDGALAKRNGSKNYVALTTFEEAEDIISQLKAKGVNNAVVNMKYCLSGADTQFDAENAKLISQLGDSAGFQNLYDYVSTQQMKLLIDVRALSSVRGRNGFSNSERLSEYAEFNRDINGVNPTTNAWFSLLRGNKIESKAAKLLKNLKDIPASGFSLCDYGIIEYGFGSSNPSMSATAEAIVNASSSLATERTLAFGYGNFNMIKYADIINGLPSETSVETGKTYVAVPFVQLVLHGTAEYTFNPVNLQLNSKQAMLKCVEYGALPSYEWYYEPLNNEQEDAVYKYDNTINDAADFYKKISVLNDTRWSRMTGHSAVQDGVYLTEYSNGARVYVNYNDVDVEVGDIVIAANDFVKIG